MRIACPCGIVATIRVFPFYCRCRRQYNADGSAVLLSAAQAPAEYPLDCQHRGAAIDDRPSTLCGCTARVLVYECRLTTPPRPCVRSKYHDGRHTETICLYCDAYRPAASG